MYYSIIFNDGTESLYDPETGMPNGKNTWDDWHLIPSSKPAIAYPEVDMANFVQIEGMSGTIDSTEMITGEQDPYSIFMTVTEAVSRSLGDPELNDYNMGEIKYVPAVQHIVFGDRTGDLDFYVTNDAEDWITIRRKIASYLNGKRLKMMLEDEPGYYYVGRFTFDTWKSDPHFSHVIIKYELEPFRYPINYGTAQEQNYSNPYWDTFNFELDYNSVGIADDGSTFINLAPDQTYIDKLKAGVL